MPNIVAKHLDPSAALQCYAVKVRSRCEEVVATALRAKHYQVLAPSYIEQRRYSDRIRKVPCALFPGYIFARLDPSNILPVVTTPGVSHVLGRRTGLEPLSDLETQTIEALCRMSAEQRQACEPCPYLRVGQRVRIEGGLMGGFEGVLVRVRNIQRVVVTIESLHSSISIEVSHADIRVLNAPLHASDASEPALRKDFGAHGVGYFTPAIQA